ncbi:hypothetical protein YC2023_122077 [Brassica napus]
MTDMADPYYVEMKQHKRDADWLFSCMYANYCIPKKCTCGGAITVKTDERGRNYYVCKVFEVRMTMVCTSDIPALTQSRKSLMCKFREEVSLHRKLQFEVEEMRKDIQELKNLLMRGR